MDQRDVLVIGAGLAGLVTALELAERGRDVLLVDRCQPEEVGGLAREAFGGMFMVDTREQRFSGIHDSVQLALEDWQRIAGFDQDDVWPRRWAEQYVARARDDVGDWLKRYGVRFFPVVNWAERGVYGDGNSVPRFHLTWGCGQALVDAVWNAARPQPTLEVRFRHRVEGLLVRDGAVVGARIVDEDRETAEYELAARHVVIAAGGIGGNLELIRANWPANLGSPPAEILMGSHYYADGAMHAEVERLGGNITHLERMWNYADAVRHPSPRRPLHGLKLIPPRSGLVLDPTWRRYGPTALIPTFDAYYALERMCEDVEVAPRPPASDGARVLKRKYYWMICNWSIARRELDVSGSQHNPSIREKRLIRFLLGILLGKPTLVRYFVERCPDFVSAHTLPELAQRMAAVTGDDALDPEQMASEVRRYDSAIARGKPLFNDDQLRRVAQLRNWRGDRLRTSRFQRIEDAKAGPLIAIRMTALARKSLGGIQTDLRSRVLRPDGSAISGLYAVGEAAGFGGGGVHGKRSLEGTFLGGCVFTARVAARTILDGHPTR